MLEKLKSFFTKFNKKENNQEIQKKNKNKLSSICSFVIIFLLFAFLIQQFGVFELLFNKSSTSNSNNNNSINASNVSSLQNQVVRVDNDFIIDDFIFENLINKKDEFSVLYKGLEEIDEYLLDCINIYNSYNLKSLDNIQFSLINGKYIYSNNNYDYIYQPQYSQISIANSSFTYNNVNDKVSVSLLGKKKYLMILDEKELSFSIDNSEYIFELNENDWTLTYRDSNNIEYCEHYRLDNCSLIEVETTNNDYLYHIFVYEEIKNETTINFSQESGVYLIYEENSEDPQETFNYNETLMIQNYYMSDAIEIYLNGIPQDIICFIVLDIYLNDMGMPFGLGK